MSISTILVGKTMVLGKTIIVGATKDIWWIQLEVCKEVFMDTGLSGLRKDIASHKRLLHCCAVKKRSVIS